MPLIIMSDNKERLIMSNLEFNTYKNALIQEGFHPDDVAKMSEEKAKAECMRRNLQLTQALCGDGTTTNLIEIGRTRVTNNEPVKQLYLDGFQLDMINPIIKEALEGISARNDRAYTERERANYETFRTEKEKYLKEEAELKELREKAKTGSLSEYETERLEYLKSRPVVPMVYKPSPKPSAQMNLQGLFLELSEKIENINIQEEAAKIYEQYTKGEITEEEFNARQAELGKQSLILDTFENFITNNEERIQELFKNTKNRTIENALFLVNDAFLKSGRPTITDRIKIESEQDRNAFTYNRLKDLSALYGDNLTKASYDVYLSKIREDGLS